MKSLSKEPAFSRVTTGRPAIGFTETTQPGGGKRCCAMPGVADLLLIDKEPRRTITGLLLGT
jgi:hypothetical protein